MITKYQSFIRIKYLDLFKKTYYVLEPDGILYLESSVEKNDLVFRRLI
ncbi:hypothetical protein FACS1894190_16510 [Spirochaetia bacterium]|nr:hypothetical protein FACS1894190_16510 [Spirochaetia bacterium]